MDLIKKNNFLFKNVISLKGVGKKLSNYLKNKKIEKINDLLWNFPYSYTDEVSKFKQTRNWKNFYNKNKSN